MTAIIQNLDCPHWQETSNELALINNFRRDYSWSMLNRITGFSSKENTIEPDG